MTERIAQLRDAIKREKHIDLRKNLDVSLAEEFHSRGVSPTRRMAERLAFVLAQECPVILPDEELTYTRTVRSLPGLFTQEEWATISAEHYLHEKGFVCNLTPDYAFTIACGLEARRKEILFKLVDSSEEEREFLECLLIEIDAVENLADRYRGEALRLGRTGIAETLGRVPRLGAQTFREALQFFRILHFTLWLEGEYHNTIGRFDQYMAPYLLADLENGRLTRDEAFELLEEFFLSFNKDSDLYPGVQQGDNGQSLVLGGRRPDGSDGFNLLSELCLEASRELKLIDPKINLRVSGNTPLEIYEKGTLLTKEGLGFPQYNNDDVVIPGLEALGYERKDAENYSVAACWEFIIPGCGADIPNIGALSFPAAVTEAMAQSLEQSATFEEFLDAVFSRIAAKFREMLSGVANLWMIPAPFLSLLMDGCVERARDASLGLKYNNYGIHGVGLATAVDSLMAIWTLVYREESIAPGELVAVVKKDFEGYDELLHRIRYELPKLGDGSDEPAYLASRLLETFADSVSDIRNERGGLLRAGTGSAMYYLWHAKDLGATPDGRRAGEPLPANYSPSLFARTPGPVSVILSFTAPDLSKTVNGGPLTLEFHDSVFRSEESVRKVASLVQYFIQAGGHQLQLNAVNRDTLIDAQRHPEDHQNLIVRVWGWSAYFNDLDREYQDHVLRRQEFTI